MANKSSQKRSVPIVKRKKWSQSNQISAQKLDKRVASLKKEKLGSIRKKLKNNDCFLGVIPHTKLSQLTVTCQKFSLIVQYKSKLISFFVTRKKIVILDPLCTLIKTKVPHTLTQFLNSLIDNRKIIIAKVAKPVKTILKLCFKFLFALYTGLSVADVLASLNLVPI